ncbi:MAG: polyphosphate kinase 1 [Bryobacterales bacterium]|nr:polyphosphate kinase 1 [Bryobacterales bacterium]MBV9401325.1 polyphosphate kinase 1 [Bryobacterales bacterium]
MASRAAQRRSRTAQLNDPSLYINRELSHLEFQRRVLEEARDVAHPVLERVKFLSILGSNLDEFFMVRVAALMQQVENGVSEPGLDGRSPAETLQAIDGSVRSLIDEAYRFLETELLPLLEQCGIRFTDLSALNREERERLDKFFYEKLFPVLTPLAFDPGRPWPHISNLSLNVAVMLRDPEGNEHFARVKIPASVPQLVPVQHNGPAFVWVEQLLISNLHRLFPGLDILHAYVFHVTRDAEVAIKELESDDLLETIEEAVRQRRFRDVVRLQIQADMPGATVQLLANQLETEPSGIFRVSGLVDLSRLKHLLNIERPDLKDKPFLPYIPPGFGAKEDDFFGLIRHQDQLLHHPYDSFQVVIDFLQKSARDPDVLAIKMTLYRLGRNAPVVDALLEAVRNGKQVAVVVELKARFDEESNIEWARALESEGVHVVYGLVGLKVHSKIVLVVRREGDAIRRYCHLGTGNYNAVTARLYTDLGMLTADEETGADATALFNYLTGYSRQKKFQKLLVAPLNMRPRLEELIEREIAVQQNGGSGHLIFKMNALEDGPMIKLLYRASQAGVRIDLIVRGACCLRPELAGISENIRVTSILGRYLEHSRIFYFHNNGEPQCYLGSADLMPRNLNRRVEVLFPVQSATLVKRLREEILETYLRDEIGARRMDSQGIYAAKVLNGGSDCQMVFMTQPHRPNA